MSKEQFPYLHGFSAQEQERLRKQASFAEFKVYQDIDLSECRDLLEVGCGVGAQTEILLRRFPQLQITGIDLNDQQLGAARSHLENVGYAQGRYRIQKMDASQMEFSSRSFDGAFLCWILEHVKDPSRVLAEVRRVLRPGGVVYITEVSNSSFFLEPYSPNVWRYWMAFNDFQYENAGDPFVGAKLGNLLLGQGFSKIETTVKTWHHDNREPHKRRVALDYWRELLLSGANQLIQAGLVDQALVDKVNAEFDTVASDPNAVFFYSFIQAKASVG